MWDVIAKHLDGSEHTIACEDEDAANMMVIAILNLPLCTSSRVCYSAL